jgi:uncharacterized surface protein with fasciclin (FAS1) repeats
MNHGKYILLLAALALFVSPAATAYACSTCGCTPAAEHDHEHEKAGKNIVETAIAAGSFKTLTAAVKAAGLVDTLSGKGPFTVFAPSDAAFAKLPEGTVEALLADKAKLKAILTYHVVPGKLTSDDVVAKSWLKTAQGQSLMVRTAGEGVTIDGASIVTADIKASNGVIHVIDTVVLPRKDIVDTAKDAKVFSTLLAAAKAAGLVDALKSEGPFTVFAPTDEAFKKLPEGTVEALLKDREKLKAILTYHVVPGRVLSGDLPEGNTAAKTLSGQKVSVVRSTRGAVTVDGAKVITADVVAGNGIIHVIDSVILPK